MQTIQTVFDTLIEQVQTSAGSLFTKDDVCSLLSDFEKRVAAIQPVQNTDAYSDTTLIRVKNNLMQKLKQDIISEFKADLDHVSTEEVIDFDSAEFDLDYGNTITLQNVEFNNHRFVDGLTEVLDNALTFENITVQLKN